MMRMQALFLVLIVAAVGWLALLGWVDRHDH
jgi:hypothetical protein